MYTLVSLLTAARVPQKDFNAYSPQLALALGLIASSERRRSGKPLEPFRTGPRRMPKNEREALEQEIDRLNARADRHADWERQQLAKAERLKEKLKAMPNDEDKWPGLTVDTPVEEIELSEEEKAESKAEAAAFVKHVQLGDGADPALQSPAEALMNGSVVSTAEESVTVEVELPEGLREENVVKTLTQTRKRYDFSVSVTRLLLDVEKKVVVTEDGQRRVLSASTSEFGPPRFAVTWGALATLAVMVGQFAMPLNRLATMLSTSLKRFTAGGLSRMAHYVAMRFLPIYLDLCDQLADSAIFAGDDTSCRADSYSHFRTCALA